MHFLPEAGKRKINGAYVKGQENERLQGVSDLGAFKLDHLQPEASFAFASDRSLKVCYDRSLANAKLASVPNGPTADSRNYILN